MQPGADSQLRKPGAKNCGREKAETPECMRSIHDAAAALMLDPIRLEVDHDFNRAHAQARGKQAQEQDKRPGCDSSQRKANGKQRH